MAQMADDEKKEQDLLGIMFPRGQQPLENPRPSIEGDPDFNEDTAKNAAKTLREAMKGMGTNEKKIINVTNSYSHPQRMVIKDMFTKVYKRDLMKDLKSELSGKFEKMCLGFWMDAGRYDAMLIEDACKGMGTDEDVLTEVICTASPTELQLMQKAWSLDKTMIHRIKSETDSGSGNYCTLLVNILEGKRAGNGAVDDEKAKATAEMLNRTITQDSKSDAKAKYVEVFSTTSWNQLRAISGIFSDIAKKYTMDGAIKKVLGDGDTAKALLTINKFASQPYDYFAEKLKKSMKGMGTNDEMLRRVIIRRAEIDLRDIGITFGNRYGDGKTLAKWLKDDLSGDYEKLCLAVCGLD